MSEKSAVYETSTIAEMTNGIILANYEKILQVQESYQSEAELEESMIKNLVLQGYEKFNGKTSDDLYKNLKVQLEKLNKITRQFRQDAEEIFSNIKINMDRQKMRQHGLLFNTKSKEIKWK